MEQPAISQTRPSLYRPVRQLSETMGFHDMGALMISKESRSQVSGLSLDGDRNVAGDDAMSLRPCPICGKAMPPSERYPCQVCASCVARAQSPDGRPLTFFNLGFGGGFGASFADTGELYDGHDCQIDGMHCRAGEARFGGIVVEVAA